MRIRATLASLPVVRRCVLVGAVSIGLLGAIAGLIIGLFTYAPTAPFAVIELGLPAAIAGAILGFVIGSVFLALSRFVRN